MKPGYGEIKARVNEALDKLARAGDYRDVALALTAAGVETTCDARPPICYVPVGNSSRRGGGHLRCGRDRDPSALLRGRRAGALQGYWDAPRERGRVRCGVRPWGVVVIRVETETHPPEPIEDEEDRPITQRSGLGVRVGRDDA